MHHVIGRLGKLLIPACMQVVHVRGLCLHGKTTPCHHLPCSCFCAAIEPVSNGTATHTLLVYRPLPAAALLDALPNAACACVHSRYAPPTPIVSWGRCFKPLAAQRDGSVPTLMSHPPTHHARVRPEGADGYLQGHHVHHVGVHHVMPPPPVPSPARSAAHRSLRSQPHHRRSHPLPLR